MSHTPLPKAAKTVLAKQLAQLPCLAVHVKFKFAYTTGRNYTGPNVLPGQALKRLSMSKQYLPLCRPVLVT